MTCDTPPIDSMGCGVDRVPIVVRIGLATTAAAAVDLALAWAYWSPHGVTVAQLLHAQARWMLGPHAVQSPQTVCVGIATGGLLYLLAALGVAGALRMGPLRPEPPGVGRAMLVGVAVYVVLFQLVVPWLAFPVVPDHSPGWIGACLAVHAALIGPLLVALLAPAAAMRHAASAHDVRGAIARFSRRRVSSRRPA